MVEWIGIVHFYLYFTDKNEENLQGIKNGPCGAMKYLSDANGHIFYKDFDSLAIA